MKDDPTIARIREARRQISEACEHDTRRLVEHYVKLQERHRGRLIRVGEPESRKSAA